MAALFDLGKLSSIVVGAIERGIETGQAASKVLESLKSIGEGIRRQTFFQAFNYIKGPITEGRSYISSLTLNSLPNISRLPKSTTDQLRNFSYKVTLRGFSSFTGKIEEQYTTIITNTLMTKQQAIDQAEALFTGAQSNYGIESASGTVTEVTQNNVGLIAA